MGTPHKPTEMEQLKEEALRQKAVQRHQAVSDYIDTLLKRAETQFALFRKRFVFSLYVLIPTSVVWAANFFVDNSYVMLAAIMLMVVTWYFFNRVAFTMQEIEKTMAEIDGCFKTLELLGLLGSDVMRKKPQKQKESLLARVWEAMKQSKRSEVYAAKPA